MVVLYRSASLINTAVGIILLACLILGIAGLRHSRQLRHLLLRHIMILPQIPNASVHTITAECSDLVLITIPQNVSDKRVYLKKITDPNDTLVSRKVGYLVPVTGLDLHFCPCVGRAKIMVATSF